MLPKTPSSSRGGQHPDTLKDNGEKGKESGHKEDVGVRSPETVVKQPVGSRSIVESSGGKGVCSSGDGFSQQPEGPQGDV
jgi:hypothetical protein